MVSRPPIASPLGVFLSYRFSIQISTPMLLSHLAQESGRKLPSPLELTALAIPETPDKGPVFPHQKSLD